jgi:hypothetical protein
MTHRILMLLAKFFLRVAAYELKEPNNFLPLKKIAIIQVFLEKLLPTLDDIQSPVMAAFCREKLIAIANRATEAAERLQKIQPPPAKVDPQEVERQKISKLMGVPIDQVHTLSVPPSTTTVVNKIS